MADHLRRQIREAVAAAVTGLATTTSNVFQSRVYPLQEIELPALLVYTGDEIISPATIHPPPDQERTLRMRVAVIAKMVDDLDDALDQIVKEIEIAVSGMSLAGIMTAIQLTDISEPELSAEGDQPTGRLTLTYETKYFVAENAPDVAL